MGAGKGEDSVSGVGSGCEAMVFKEVDICSKMQRR